MKIKYVLLVIILISGLLLSCTKSNPSEPGAGVSDLWAIKELIDDEYMSLLGSNTHYGIEDTIGSDRFFPMSDILTLFWYRHVDDSFSKDINVHISNDSAWIDITFTGYGDLKLFYLDSLFQLDSLYKSFSDDFSRSAIFVREGSTGDPYRGWKLRALTPASVQTQGANLYIDSAVISTSDTIYHITNSYLNGYTNVDDSLSNLISVRKGDSISVTLFVHGDSMTAFMHISWDEYHRRAHLLPDTTYPGVFVRPHIPLSDTMPPIVNFCFDVLKYTTLYTDDQPYFAKAYIFPVKVIE